MTEVNPASVFFATSAGCLHPSMQVSGSGRAPRIQTKNPNRRPAMFAILMNVLFFWFVAVFFTCSFVLHVVHAVKSKERVLHIALLVVRALALMVILLVVAIMIGEKVNLAAWSGVPALAFFVMNLIARFAFAEYHALTNRSSSQSGKGGRRTNRQDPAATSSGHQAPTAPVE